MDPGSVSIITVGIVGIAIDALVRIATTNPTEKRLTNKCEWQDASSLPFYCDPKCQPEFEPFHLATGDMLSASITGDTNFGGDCRFGTKRFCCQSEVSDNHWAGIWLSVRNQVRVRCKYHANATAEFPDVGKCGVIWCEMLRRVPISHDAPMGLERHTDNDTIHGSCDLVSLFGLEGRVTAGQALFEQRISEDPAMEDVWVKLST